MQGAAEMMTAPWTEETCRKPARTRNKWDNFWFCLLIKWESWDRSCMEVHGW